MKILLALLPFLLLGCSTGSLTNNAFSKLPDDKDKAQIYIYRPSIPEYSFSLDIPLFFINDKRIGPLQMSGYYAETFEPGPTEIYFKHNGLFGTSIFEITQNFKFITEAGKTYFIRLDGAGFIAKTQYSLSIIPSAVGILEIQSMKQMSPKFSFQ